MAVLSRAARVSFLRKVRHRLERIQAAVRPNADDYYTAYLIRQGFERRVATETASLFADFADGYGSTEGLIEVARRFREEFRDDIPAARGALAEVLARRQPSYSPRLARITEILGALAMHTARETALLFIEKQESPYDLEPEQFLRLYEGLTDEVAQSIDSAARTHASRTSRILVDAANPRSPRTVEETARRVRGEIRGMTRRQALTVTRTETARVYGRVSHETYTNNGVEYHQWLTASRSPVARISDVCAICSANAEDGVIPVTSAFSSGDRYPPAHPNCRCDVAPVIPGLSPGTGSVDDYWPGEGGGSGAYDAENFTPPPEWSDPAFKRSRPANWRPRPKPEFSAERPNDAWRWIQDEFPDVDFEFTGMDPRLLVNTADHLDDLLKAYPEVRDRLQYVTLNTRMPVPRSDYYQHSGLDNFDRIGSGNAYAYATRDGTTIALNPRWYGSGRYDEYTASIQSGTKTFRKGETPFHPKGAEAPESTIIHEFGHHVQNWLEAAPPNLSFMPNGAARASGLGLVRDTTNMFVQGQSKGSRLSVYARANDHEWFAEAFTQRWMVPKSRWSADTKRIDGFLERVGTDSSRWSRVDFDQPFPDKDFIEIFALFK